MAAGDFGLGGISAETSSALGSIIDGTDESTSSPETGGEQSAYDELASVIDGTDDTPVEEVADEPVQQEEQTETEQVAEGGDPASTVEGDFKLTPDGSSYLVPKDILPQLQAEKKFAASMREHFQSPEDAKIARDLSEDYRGMRSDMLSGNEDAIQEFLDHWSGKPFESIPGGYADQMRESFQSMVRMLPNYIQKMNPGFHEEFMGGVLDAYLDHAYSQNIGDPQAVAALQRAEFAMTGKYRTDDRAAQMQFGAKPLTAQQQAQAGQPDWFQQQQQQLNTQKQQIEQASKRAEDSAFGNFRQTALDAPKWKEYEAEVDRFLAPVKEAYEKVKDTDTFGAIREKVLRETLDKIRGDNEFKLTHGRERDFIEKAFRRAHQRGDMKAIQALTPAIKRHHNDLMIRVRSILPSVAKSFVNSATKSFVAQREGKTGQPPQKTLPTRANNGQFTQPKQGQQQVAQRGARGSAEFNALFPDATV